MTFLSVISAPLVFLLQRWDSTLQSAPDPTDTVFFNYLITNKNASAWVCMSFTASSSWSFKCHFFCFAWEPPVHVCERETAVICLMLSLQLTWRFRCLLLKGPFDRTIMQHLLVSNLSTYQLLCTFPLGVLMTCSAEICHICVIVSPLALHTAS